MGYNLRAERCKPSCGTIHGYYYKSKVETIQGNTVYIVMETRKSSKWDGKNSRVFRLKIMTLHLMALMCVTALYCIIIRCCMTPIIFFFAVFNSSAGGSHSKVPSTTPLSRRRHVSGCKPWWENRFRRGIFTRR